MNIKYGLVVDTNTFLLTSKNITFKKLYKYRKLLLLIHKAILF